MRFIIILLLCFIVINLFIGLFHIISGKQKNTSKAVRSLTVRVAASIVLFAFIVIIVYLTSNH